MADQPQIVIVAEDEFLIRCVAAEAITAAGFMVIEARSAADALVAIEQHPQAVALFTDIRMPGALDGLEMARRVRAMLPDLVIMVASGHAGPSMAEMPDNGVFFSKPYSVTAVAQRLTAMVQARRAAAET